MTLTELRYVVAVARERHFGRAAEACFVSQPTLSVAVKKLEEELDLTLFERGPGEVSVTPAGQRIVEQAQRVLEEASRIKEIAAAGRDPLAGPLRLGVIPTVAPYVLPSVVPPVARTHPRLQLLIREGRTAELIRELHAGTLDAALLAHGAELAGLAEERVADDAFVLATPRGHPLARRRAVGVEELAGHEVFLLEDGHCFRDQVLPLCARGGAHEAGFRGTSLSTLAQMVGAGAGVTLLPMLAVATENRGKQLDIRPFRGTRPGRQLVLASRSGGARAAAIRAIAVVMREAWPRPRPLESRG